MILLALALLAQPGPSLTVGGNATAGNPIVEHADDEAFRIGKLIRCPVCQGMPIAESPSEMAQDMMRTVRRLHAEGKSKEEILAYFEERYGEFARLAPKAEGVNLMVWLLPLVGVLLALVLITQRIGKGPAPRTAAASSAQSTESTSESDADSSASEESDSYLQAVREEVQR